jgi:hypothetical protein
MAVEGSEVGDEVPSGSIPGARYEGLGFVNRVSVFPAHEMPETFIPEHKPVLAARGEQRIQKRG